MNVTRYAKSGDLSIAYQIVGDGPFDLVVVPGIVSHVEAFHELPGYSRFIERLLLDPAKCSFPLRSKIWSRDQACASQTGAYTR